MKYKTVLQKTLISIAVAATLTACGGGGDNGGNSLTTPTPANITLGGAVGKGIIKKGIITAYELKANDTKLEVGSAITDDNGAYNLTLASSYTGGAILIELTADTDTTMVCDALDGCPKGAENYGLNITLSSEFNMQAISPPASAGDKVSVQVTPFSHMAAANAQAVMSDINSTKTAADAVSDAVDKIKQITGVNILTTKPVDITKNDIDKKTVDEQRYALLNAAFADVVYSTGDSADLQQTLDTYATEFKNGVFDANDGDDKKEENLSALLDNLDKQIKDSENSDLSKAARNSAKAQAAIIKQSTGDGGAYNPEPTDNTNKTDIEKAKALVSETRTWLTSFNDLESPAGAFGTDIETISTTLNSNTGAVLETAMKAVEAGTNAIVKAIEDGDTTLPEFATVLTGNDLTITDIVKTSTQTSYKLSATDLAGVKMNFSLSIDKSLAELEALKEDLKGKTLNITLSGAASNDQISTTLNESVISLETHPVISNDDSPILKNLSLTGGITLAILNNGTPTGDEVSADAIIKFVTLNPGVQEGWRSGNNYSDPVSSLSIQQIKLGEAKVTNAEGSTAGLTIDLTIDNAASLDTFAFLKNNHTVSFHKYYKNSDPLGFVAYDHGFATLHYGSYQSDYDSNGHTTFDGLLTNGSWGRFTPEDNDPLGIEAYVKSEINPSKYVDSSSIHNIYAYYNNNDYGINTDLGASFRVDSKETAESFIKGSLLLSGNMSLKGYEPATAAITVNRTGYKAGNASIKLAYNGRILDIAVSNVTGTLTAGTANGTKMIVTGEGGIVTVSGKEVAKISDDTNGLMIIRYNDGTVESLFNTAGLRALLDED